MNPQRIDSQQTNLNQLAQEAAADEAAFTKLTERSEGLILRCASSACKRYITKSDDEWSIALLAFHQAVQDYSADKGSFLPFAELVIRRRLTDYQRREQRRQPEISVSPAVFSGESEEPDGALQRQVLEQTAVSPEQALPLEIEAANQIFSGYGFSFFDLADCSPKAGKTRKACAKAILWLLGEPELLQDVRLSHYLPVKKIEISAEVPRKILDRHRKYIIAAVEILSGDFPCLAEYMRWIREELKA